MKVFIADDEIYIIELLLHLIDWDALGLEVVGTAVDGVSALEKVIQTTPDIVITDIRMPGINGLDMIKAIQDHNKATAFIIISGHNNFEYAQTAIRFGVKDYILKPINAEDLTKILENLTSEMKNNLRYRTEVSEMNVKFDTAKLKLQSSFLEKACEDSFHSIGSLEGMNDEFLLNLRAGRFQLLIMKFDCKLNHDENIFPEQLHERTLFNIQRYLESISFETIAAAYPFQYNILINYDPSAEVKVQHNLQYFLDDMIHLCKKYSNLYFTICKGSEETDFTKIHVSYQNALCSLRQRILGRLDTVIEAPDTYNSSDDLNRIFSPERQEGLKRCIERFEMHEIRVQITRLFTAAEGLGIDHAKLFWDLCQRIYALFLDVTQNLNIFIDSRQEMETFMRSLDQCTSIAAVRSALLDRITEHNNYYLSQEDSFDNTYISIAKKYIRDHYMEKISLEDIAQLVFLNPVYFSILFKQEIGINFVDYLNQYRIEMAKTYLKDISKPLAEISALVGFVTPKYFSKVFKRIVGITPSQYRDKYMRHSQI